MSTHNPDDVAIPKKKGYFFPIISVIWFMLLIVVILSIQAGYNNRKIYISATHTKSKAIAQLLGENTSGILHNVDLTLLSVLEKIEKENPDDPYVRETIIQSINRQFRFLPQIKSIILFDSGKNIIYTHGDSQTIKLDSSPELSTAALTGGGLITYETSGAIVSVYRLMDVPFLTSVSYQKDRVLHDWYEKTRHDMAIVSALVLMGIAITALAWSQRKRRKKAEKELTDA